MTSASPNHEYLAARAAEFGGRVLDFGCGRGQVVRVLRKRGVEAYGADVFFEGMSWGAETEKLLAEGVVRRIVNGRLPFDDDTFDTIVSDQVVEHIEDLTAVVHELGRVLRPGGVMYHQFPVLESIREAHTAVLAAHLVAPRLRRPYLEAARSLGFGKHTEDFESSADWANHFTDWLEAFCHYRRRSTVRQIFWSQGFVVEHDELRYCRWRAGDNPWIERAIDISPRLAVWAFRCLGFDCVIVRAAAD